MMRGTQTALRWQRDAACLDYPQAWWFPGHRSSEESWAKEICGRCLVRHECLVYAMGGNEDHGIWGGFGIRDIDEFKKAACRCCRRRMPPEEIANLAIAGMERRRWTCRACWYRNIMDRRRT